MLAAELLFQEVISVFVFGHLAGVVIGLAVNFDCDFGLRRCSLRQSRFAGGAAGTFAVSI